MAQYAVLVERLDEVGADVAALPEKVVKAARLAVNATLRRGRASAAREVRLQANLPARYLSGDGGRLRVSRFAQGRDLEGAIQGRARPTSLAQFVTGGARLGKRGGVTVSVKPGTSKALPRAFLIKLKQGSGSVDTKFNLGLAMRLRPGETIKGKHSFRKIAGNLYLLYGPSVQQILLHGSEGSEKGVFVDIAPGLGDYFENEFRRLLELDLNG